MPVVALPRLRTVFLLCLGGLTAVLIWTGGCARPKPRQSAAALHTVRQAGTETVGASVARFRLARDMERSRRQEALLRLIEADRLDEEIRAEAERELWRLTRLEAAEHEAEAVLAMQGWPEAAVTVAGDEVTVIVPGRALTAAEAGAIGRAVADATCLGEAAVRILERP